MFNLINLVKSLEKAAKSCRFYHHLHYERSPITLNIFFSITVEINILNSN